MGKNIFVSFLKLLKIPHTRRFSSKYYHEHPHKNNLLGLSSMLSHYGIKNVGLKMTNETDLIQFDCPFIAHMEDGFALVKNINEKEVSYIDENTLKNKTISLANFTKKWTGNILLAEPQADSHEPRFIEHRKEEYLKNGKISLLCLSLVFVLAKSTYQNTIKEHTEFGIYILIFSMIGAFLCMLLIKKKLKMGGLADRICSLFNSNGCSKILDFKMSGILGILDWTDIGLGFFISNIVIVCFFPDLVKYQILIDFLGLPYTIWSVWYQKFKAKQWCPLCLSVIFTLWGIYCICFVFYKWIEPFLFIDFLLTGSIFITIILSISFLTPILQDNKDLIKAKYAINHIKSDENVFGMLLSKQEHYPKSELHSQILLGNPHANHTITILTNPHCGPCALMHQRVHTFLKVQTHISVRYIFSSFHESLDESRKFLIAIYLQERARYYQIYDEWFKFGKYHPEDFFKKYPVNIHDEKVLAECNLHQKWIVQSQLNATPTILFDGYKLPDNYSIEDLLHIEFESIYYRYIAGR